MLICNMCFYLCWYNQERSRPGRIRLWKNFHLRALTATMMVHPVLQRRFAVFWKKNVARHSLFRTRSQKSVRKSENSEKTSNTICTSQIKISRPNKIIKLLGSAYLIFCPFGVASQPGFLHAWAHLEGPYSKYRPHGELLEHFRG